MAKNVITAEITEVLKRNQFLALGTCGFDMQPIVVPKLLLKVEGDCLYLGDFSIDKTLINVRDNPKVSLSCYDTETLTGYQINGIARTIEEGPLLNRIFKLFIKRKIALSSSRIIEGVRKEHKHKSFEMELPDKIVVYKVKVREIIAEYPKGTLEIKKIL